MVYSSRKFLHGLRLSGLALMLCATPALALEPAAPAGLASQVTAQIEEAVPELRDGRAYLAAPYQAMQAEVSTSGLTLHSQVKGKTEALQITPLAIGKDTLADITKGDVALAGNTIELRRNGISEVFSSSLDGIRQDFLIHHKPAGSKPLTLALAVQGATLTGSGQQLSLHTNAGRHLLYNKLHITDADGKVLPGQMLAVNTTTLHITVDDSQARYPLLIDPTYSDANWQSLGSGANGMVLDFIVFNGKLYAAGNFTEVDDVTVNSIAVWDGIEWSALGGGMNGDVYALAVFNNQLIAGGYFTEAGGVAARSIAAWNGSSWSALGDGVRASSAAYVNALTVFNHQLIASGFFTQAGDVAVNCCIAAWDGSSWSALGGGISGQTNDLTVFGDKLIAGNSARMADSSFTRNIAAWDGLEWSALGDGVDSGVSGFAVFNNQLIVIGSFTEAGGVAASRIAAWDGSVWSALGDGLNQQVEGITVFDNQLIVSGNFTQAGNIPANRIAAWDGTDWSALGSGLDGFGWALTVFNKQLIVGGSFTQAGGKVATSLAAFNSAYATAVFNSQGGSAVADITLEVGDWITLPTAPTRSGYTFKEWNTEPDGSGVTYNSDFQMPATGINLYAQWTVLQYAITFDSNGGTAIAPLSLTAGTAISHPPAPVRTGYSFTGWNPILPTTMPAANLSVTAQWTANQYSITFDSNDGNAVNPVSLAFGSTITPPADSVHEGYTFTGWSPALPATMPAENLSVTAQWTANQYSITFDSNDGNAVNPVSLAFGSTITPPADPVREGYTFTGWSPALPATMPAENLSVTAQWTANQYSIIFDSNGGSAVAPTSLIAGAAITAPGNPVRAGYTFTGWNPALPATMPAANLTLTAQWAADLPTPLPVYSITFDSNGGNAVTPINLIANAAITAPANPVRAGYTFTGWNPALPSTMPAANLTLTAQWAADIPTPLPVYSITFDSNGGNTVTPINLIANAAITAPANPVREGYTFTGWSPALPATMPAANLTLTAQWTADIPTPLPVYSITFDSNGGNAVTPINLIADAVITAPANPVRAGYTFTGWNPALPSTMPAANLTLTAQWTAIPVDSNTGRKKSGGSITGGVLPGLLAMLLLWRRARRSRVIS